MPEPHASTSAPASTPLLQTRGLTLVTSEGRTLVRQLDLALGRDHVALVGRNGVGKSSLLATLAGHAEPTSGVIHRHRPSAYVAQRLCSPETFCPRDLFGPPPDSLANDERLQHWLARAGLPDVHALFASPQLSRGQQRKVRLIAARRKTRQELLLLDEPAQDLDVVGIDWLLGMLSAHRGGALVATHHRTLLEHFQHFFVLEESGCRYFAGAFAELERDLHRRLDARAAQFARRLQDLGAEQRHDARVRQRRARKKNLGRLHEERRAPSRAQLHGKKGYAQSSQGKAKKIRDQRLRSARTSVLVARRHVPVVLPLKVLMPPPPPPSGPIVTLEDVRIGHDRVLASGVNLTLERERIGVIGPNGSGKSTLLAVLRGETAPREGRVRVTRSRVAGIRQGATEWLRDDSLAQMLMAGGAPPDELTALLLAHRFPLALAQRSLRTLSAGERVRAALIALTVSPQPPELLVLDEPTYSLDFVGVAALVHALESWRGGLVVASHDRAFLDAVGVDGCWALSGDGGVPRWIRHAAARR